MTAVTAARDTFDREGRKFRFVVATGENIYQGTLCQLDSSGELVEAIVATGNVSGFIARETVLDAAAGAELDVESNIVVQLDNGNSLDASNIGGTAYAQDNATVHNTASTRSSIGQIVDVDANGVWVLLLPQIVSGLAAANDLSDVGDVPTARVNLGVDRVMVQLTDALDLIGGNAAELRYVHVGPDMDITRLAAVISLALTTADAVITADINTVAVTLGVITITQAASAEDDIGTADPSAARTLSEDDVLTLTVSGTQDAAAFAAVSMELTFV